MNDPVFLDSAAFLRVWQRVTGEAGITAAPEQPETDPLTAQLRGCICAKAAGTAFYAALERAQLRALQTEYFLRTGALCVAPAACPRPSTAAADLRCIYWQELALSARLDAAADAALMPLREALHAMAQQDARHAQRVRTLLTGLIF